MVFQAKLDRWRLGVGTCSTMQGESGEGFVPGASPYGQFLRHSYNVVYSRPKTYEFLVGDCSPSFLLSQE